MSHTVGNTIEAFCKACAGVIDHTVSKLTGTRISKVVCATCSDEHAYRKGFPKNEQGSEAQKAASERRKVNKAATAFAAVMGSVDPNNAVPYSFANRFEEDDVIEHQTFGLGKVTRILSGNKMEVIFKASSKILMHDRANHAPR